MGKKVAEASMSEAVAEAHFGQENNKIILKAENLTYKVKDKKKEKCVLSDLNLTYGSGELAAIMGPSGAGKTSLLNVLSNSRSKKNLTGKIKLNGDELPKGYKNICSYIPQNDVLYAGLTPRQSIEYAAKLRLPVETDPVERDAIVKKLIDDLGLEKCADTLIGDNTTRGISGGEKKRTSIGVELIVNPVIVLVDEPTSGLDSKMAEDVVEMLGQLCKEHGRLVLCTIHQPSWKIFEMFDKLTLLRHGKTVYHGQSSQIIEYFDKLELKVPDFENPLDFYFKQIQENDEINFALEWTNVTKNDPDKFETELAKVPVSGLISGKNIVKGWKTNANSDWDQFKILFSRLAQDTVRDRRKFTRSIIMKLVMALLLGTIFIGQSDGTNDGVFTSNGGMFFIVMSTIMRVISSTILEYPLIKPLLIREYRNGAFSIFPYFLAQLLNNTLFESFGSFLYLTAYFMIGFEQDIISVLYFMAILVLLVCICCEVGLAIGANAQDTKDAQKYFIPVIMPNILFAGFFIPYEQIPFYFQWIYYVSFVQYAVSSILINEFEDQEFADCQPGALSGSLANGSCATFTADGFCFTTGEELLKEFSLQPSFLQRNLIILVGYILVLIPITYHNIRKAIIKGAATV
uniref:ABC transporter domain-containing protein n=1 Tax=Aplanochytrium stocchinoi TaxID=215587 RepID=A0A7S3UXL6_9STRA|mmetsp:Transcript_20966/g.25447  ORF Transcript_20966/g.25447 Transcript_20966/m.25447 type:complete len:631 (+) Transcript_20966:231-2123(+)|eukprot:CAMPEP_0204841280 /NCGR_PEP_ID=MMETSP1346-20131115/41359_1 /ASSEMBLY_ACC=CAM_ASM_000771 /TAXON_ID=215587 /ORGANISM="Aplanochytrium stocchinoi, Strain GSBS06" /LENGTH=630 /DNA_ID=CAMNT_0051979307 /DNA_START=158 /DNA_END=2050 /DNA_ORIENTATION=-